MDGASVPYAVWALAPDSQWGVSEEQTRAAAAFGSAVADEANAGDGSTAFADPGLGQLYEDLGLTLSETPTPEPEAGEQEQDGQPGVVATDRDTLLLLDTSAATEPSFETNVAAVADLAHRVAGAGHGVALWNYSSPLNPGVTKPWRDNVDFGPAEPVADAAALFGTGGTPMTRSATVAAAGRAAQHAAETASPTRLVVLTSGTDPNDLSEEDFRVQLEEALGGADVEIVVVSLGDAPADPALLDHPMVHAGRLA